MNKREARELQKLNKDELLLFAGCNYADKIEGVRLVGLTECMGFVVRKTEGRDHIGGAPYKEGHFMGGP
jgi:hypothetical protein